MDKALCEYACPMCTRTDMLRVRVTTEARLVQDGGEIETRTDLITDAGSADDWRNSSEMRCDNCQFQSPASDFITG